KIRAPIEGIVRRRLQSGLRSRARGSLADARIEQVGKRRLDRRLLRPRRLGARGLRRVLLRLLWRFRHSRQYGRSATAREAGRPERGAAGSRGTRAPGRDSRGAHPDGARRALKTLAAWRLNWLATMAWLGGSPVTMSMGVWANVPAPT